ncbi:MAG: (2Fe-2S)-binding protein [marine benthic group bacterium]|nr:(2Fe-2S)-binding protein [Gemmatimonadota bacterium]
MATITLTVNGRLHTVDVEPDMPLLWVLRDILGLTGTKFGCGKALCGSCTVHRIRSGVATAVRSCALPIATLDGAEIVTIEGLSDDGSHAVQRAWIEEDVPQCGYCQPGQIMAAAALLAADPRPRDAEIDRAMRGVLCRCGTHARIRAAIHRAAAGGGDR